MYQPPTSMHPSHSSAAYPPQTPAYPPQTAAHPPRTAAYPPQISAYPSQTSAYPPQTSAYPPQTSAYQQTSTFPSQMSMPGQGQEYLRNIFKSVDKDGSGFISVNELQTALSNGSWTPFNIETVKLMIAMYDKERRGEISFQDFGALWKFVDDWQRCFRTFDRDNSGSIDTRELQDALNTFGFRLSNEAVHMVTQNYAGPGRSGILFDDFIKCCIILNKLTSTFRQYDHDNDGFVNMPYEMFVKMVFGFGLM